MNWLIQRVQSHLASKVALSLMLSVLGLAACRKSPPPSIHLADVKRALAEDNRALATNLVEQISVSDPDWAASLLLLGEHASKAGRYTAALNHYQQISDRAPDPETALKALYFIGEMQRALGQLSKAVQSYRRVLEKSPENAATHERLAFLLSATGNSWEATEHYFFLAKSGTATLPELVLLADFDRPVEQAEFLEECAAQAPDDALVQLGLAAQDFVEGKSSQAEKRLRSLLAESPELLAGQALLGELLVDRGEQEFAAWHQQLPVEAIQHPGIWYVRGLWARRQGEFSVAGRCFFNAIQLAPTHRRAIYQLSQILKLLGDDSASLVEAEAERLIELTQTLDDVLRVEGKDERAVRKCAELLEQSGRIWEACAWSVWARDHYPDSQWPQEIFTRWFESLTETLPMVMDSSRIEKKGSDVKLSPMSELEFHLHQSHSATPSPSFQSQISFVETEQAIDFTYSNGADLATPGARSFEQTGGGVAVIDFDHDGRPDLYFPQGGTWKTGEVQPRIGEPYSDALFRGIGPTGFENVSDSALPQEADFGQGCTVGDFNNDGFADIYVANIGQNRLYENQGDGTFLDVTASSGLDRQEWTTSTLLTDLNADGIPDLFDVNYVRGPNVYTAICDGKACSPKVFEGTPDRLYIGNGNGTFEHVEFGASSRDSKGLGIMTVPVEDPLRPALFIANDQVPNFMLWNRPAANSKNIQLEDDAFLRGVAFDRDGMAMACMGVAADDVDGNGTIDLFVTNFKDESNTLYLQDTAGLFDDATIAFQLRSASLPYVGWGTQFLDADRDGHPDLVVTNGHVDDYRSAGGAYHMPVQFFRNSGNGALVELTSKEIGPFFDRKLIGRALARLDWNQDGLMDFVISSINEPVSLVTNTSPHPGHFINLRLSATRTARDAIGTRVVVKTDRRVWTKTLLAGDGYMASNERLLQFGLGDSSAIRELHVYWPSGHHLTQHNVPLDVTLQLTEDFSVATLWRNSQPESYSITEDSH